MKEGFADRVRVGIAARMQSALGELTQQTKGVKPFNSKPLTDKDELEMLENMDLDDWRNLEQDQGIDIADGMRVKRDTLRRQLYGG